MIERGKKEKERRDKRAREEELAVGMQVLLKNKAKKKGQPKYDPRPYTITELNGRQALLERGQKKIRRETQKFKRFYEPRQPKQQDSRNRTEDDWEESWRRKNGTAQQDTGHDLLIATNADNTAPRQLATATGQDRVP